MEADLRRGILPAPDLEEACGGGPAHALSEESGVTADSSRSALLGDADSSSLSIEWTDEKHNLYLNLLERSFVDQLNHSKRMRGAILREVVGVPYPPSELPMENCASFDEVLQDGLWQKINFRRMKNSSDSHVVKSPRTRHVVTTGNVYPLEPHTQQYNEEVHMTGNRNFSSGLPSSSTQHYAHHVRHHNPVGGTAEVSDQNFVNEDGKRNSAYSPVPKRARRSSADGSSNDQVVPRGGFRSANASVFRHGSSKEQQGNSEDPD
ncbi:cold-regulated protein 27-like isoform X2 [Punica granatum]|uniref:Cold-regulated protein 27-like isoform X2 n=1 Tax=Punica granatum TaxID=22663 RepID=A0A6P8DHU8_PUNGR|nr:cold-regulated protein 27-like isoform X2 [Punica granatum]